MKTWGPLEVCALICLVTLSALLLQGKDSALTTTFLAISGGIFMKGLGIEIRQRVWRKKDTKNGPA